METGRALADLAGRVLLAHIFLISGLTKITGYEGAQGYMESVGLPGALLPLVILWEAGAALLLILGLLTRWAALALGIFSALAAIYFHADFGEQMQMIQWMKNWTITGGMLVVAAYGAGPYSIDARRARSRR